ncbi:MAG: hypothetical protein R2712_22290 [Vicinamibacterales bacterium]
MTAPIDPREGEVVLQRAIRIRASPSRVLNAFFDPDDLAAWWEVSHSVTLLRPLGPFAVQWPPTDFTDEVLGRLGGILHGTVLDCVADESLHRGRLLAAAGRGADRPDGAVHRRSSGRRRLTTELPSVRAPMTTGRGGSGTSW